MFTDNTLCESVLNRRLGKPGLNVQTSGHFQPTKASPKEEEISQ
jgi:hypothetical protein